jgi:hypothetical protein
MFFQLIILLRYASLLLFVVEETVAAEQIVCTTLVRTVQEG